MLLSVLYGLLALLVFYAYLVALRKTDETMLGVTCVFLRIRQFSCASDDFLLT